MDASAKAQYRALRDNPLLFFALLTIHSKDTHELISLALNEVQELVYKALLTHKRIIVLKCRQGGVSTLLRAWAFHQVFFAFNKQKRWGTVSITDTSAQELNQMDASFYSNLPAFMKRKLSRQNQTIYEFADTKSYTAAFSASSAYGTRSWTLSDAHGSEFAFWRDQEEMLATINSTVGQEGQIVLESTPNRRGDHFYNLCMDALAGRNDWHVVEIWWWMLKRNKRALGVDASGQAIPLIRTKEEIALEHEYKTSLSDEQLNWRRSEVSTVGIYKFRRENPGCLNDAFFNIEGAYYDSADIAAITADATRGSEWWLQDKDQHPSVNDIYMAGVDPSGGVGSDDSAIVVWSKARKVPVYALWDNRLNPSALADRLIRLNALKFNGQLRVAVESNNHGAAVLLALRMRGYPESLIYRTPEGGDFVTSVQSKTLIHESLRAHLSTANGRPAMVGVLPQPLVNQLASLTIPAGKVNPQAPDGEHDDLAMAAALGYHALDFIREKPRAAETPADHAAEARAQADRSRRLRQANSR